MAIINIQSVTQDPQSWVFELKGQQLDLDSEVIAHDPIKIVCELYRLGQKMHIQGQIQAQLQMVCSRCLNDFSLALQVPFLFIAVPEHELGSDAKAADTRKPQDDPAVIAYREEQVDLLPEIRSTLLLAVPMKPLCQEDCRGLCPQCGERLADGRCHCGQENRQHH